MGLRIISLLLTMTGTALAVVAYKKGKNKVSPVKEVEEIKKAPLPTKLKPLEPVKVEEPKIEDKEEQAE